MRWPTLRRLRSTHGPGVSWGSWDAFVAGTAELLAALPRPVVVVAAVLATAVEIVPAVLLLKRAGTRAESARPLRACS